MELMLEGVVCQSCGSFIGPPVGYPQDCEDCKEEE